MFRPEGSHLASFDEPQKSGCAIGARHIEKIAWHLIGNPQQASLLVQEQSPIKDCPPLLAASRIAPTFAISGTATVLDDLGKNSDRDLFRTLGADCETDGGANAGDIRLRQPGCPQPLNAPLMVAL
jgi:fermentation-respiration switch protein FrsA (DUF1100 family)